MTPLERWEISQPGNVLRVFERGGGPKGEVGDPARADDAGKPDDKLSTRGFGTQLRTDPVFLGLQKTRLLDPLLSLPGHERSARRLSRAAAARRATCLRQRSLARAFRAVRDIRQSRLQRVEGSHDSAANESGHPIRHAFTRSIPSSQCMVCHVHPGTNMVTTYFGYTWWDNESDGDAMYPKQQRNPDRGRRIPDVAQRNPEGAARAGCGPIRNFWRRRAAPTFNAQTEGRRSSPIFTATAGSSAPCTRATARATCSTQTASTVASDDPKKFDKAAHLEDIHLRKGHAVRGLPLRAGQPRQRQNSTASRAPPSSSIASIATARFGNARRCVTSGPAAPAGGTHLDALRTPWRSGDSNGATANFIQRSMMEHDREWEVVQTLDSITPGNPHYNEKSRLAKTLRTDGAHLGRRAEGRIATRARQQQHDLLRLPHVVDAQLFRLPPVDDAPTSKHAHAAQRRADDAQLDLVQLPGAARRRLHAGRGRHGDRTSRRAGALVVRDSGEFAEPESRVALQHAADGFGRRLQRAGVQHVRAAHGARARKPRACTDCHVSAARDNNAWMSMLLLQGTNLLNFMGRYVYVAAGNKGFDAVVTAEHDEPRGRHRQRSAAHGLSRRLPQARRARARTRRQRIATTETFSTCSFAANIPTRRWARAASASSTSPTLTTRVFPSAWSPRRCRRSASACT